MEGQTSLRRLARRQHAALRVDVLALKCNGRSSCVSRSYLRQLNEVIEVNVEDANVFHPFWRYSEYMDHFCSPCRSFIVGRCKEVRSEAWKDLATFFDVPITWPVRSDEAIE